MAALTHACVLASGRVSAEQAAKILEHYEELTMPPMEDPFNLSPVMLIDFMIGDFKSMWEALAKDEKAGSRGNLMFGLHAMILLEVVFRACWKNGAALRDFLEALGEKEPRYFWELPALFSTENEIGEVPVPAIGGVEPERQLLVALFHVMRHGHAHQYQQTKVKLADSAFGVSLAGADYTFDLERHTKSLNRLGHLAHHEYAQGVVLHVRPEALFCDFRDAIYRSRLRERELDFRHFTRASNVTTAALMESFGRMNTIHLKTVPM